MQAAMTAWLAANADTVAVQAGTRHLLPDHHSTAAFDAHLGTVRDYLDARTSPTHRLRHRNRRPRTAPQARATRPWCLPAAATRCPRRTPARPNLRHLRPHRPPYETVAMVLLGRESFIPEHRFLSEEEALDVVRYFRSHHPARVRLFTAVLGWGDLRSDDAVRDFVRSHPFVAIRPSGRSGS